MKEWILNFNQDVRGIASNENVQYGELPLRFSIWIVQCCTWAECTGFKCKIYEYNIRNTFHSILYIGIHGQWSLVNNYAITSRRYWRIGLSWSYINFSGIPIGIIKYTNPQISYIYQTHRFSRIFEKLNSIYMA